MAAGPAVAGARSDTMTIIVTVTASCQMDPRILGTLALRSGMAGTSAPTSGPGLRCSEQAPESVRLWREIQPGRTASGRRSRVVITTVDF